MNFSGEHLIVLLVIGAVAAAAIAGVAVLLIRSARSR